jgi:hypothetical protein
MMHQFSKIENLTDLERRIRGWTSFSDPDVYDFGGLVVLLGAILDNMNAHGPHSHAEQTLARNVANTSDDGRWTDRLFANERTSFKRRR